jgi:hypothetical protein
MTATASEDYNQCENANLSRRRRKMRKLTVDRTLFQEAFKMGDSQADAFLDVETGEVVIITNDEWRVIEDIDEDEETDETLNIALARQVYEGRDTRYLQLDKQDSREGYQDMEIFITDLGDEHLREVLETAIRGSGAFRRFKEVLYRYPEAQKAWFAFRDERIAMRMNRWFEHHEIEVIFV